MLEFRQHLGIFLLGWFIISLLIWWKYDDTDCENFGQAMAASFIGACIFQCIFEIGYWIIYFCFIY